MYEINRTYMKLNHDSLKEFFHYSLRYYGYYCNSISVIIPYKISIIKDIKRSVDPVFAALIAAYARRCIIESKKTSNIGLITDCPLCKIFKVCDIKVCFDKFIDTRCFGGVWCFYDTYNIVQKNSLSKNDVAYKIVGDEIKKRSLDVEPLWLPRLGSL